MYPDTLWSFKHELKFVSKKASFPHLGCLNVVVMLPRDWNKKLIDMNIDDLKDEQIICADNITAPLQLRDLVSIDNYTSMNLYYSRCCPHDCDFYLLPSRYFK
jgi:hypothetical protein